MAHIGKNVSRLRGLFQIPLKEMAAQLKMVQQEYTKLEHKESIDDDLLDKIAAIFKIPVEKIKSLDETMIQNVYQHDSNQGTGFDFRKTDSELYERLIAEKDEVIKAKDELLRVKDQLITVLKRDL